MTKGILVVAHGSRLLEANKEFQGLVEILRKSTARDVRGANLTLAEPGIGETVEGMYKDGYREITLIPYFLSNGKHVSFHIPTIIKKLEDALEGLTITLETTLVMDLLVIKALENKINKN